jgi:fluoroacetyl-CoA thioesterase
MCICNFPGLSVTVTVVLEKVEGRRLLFSVKAKDDLDLISEGTHERFIINAGSFNKKVLDKFSRYSLKMR